MSKLIAGALTLTVLSAGANVLAGPDEPVAATRVTDRRVVQEALSPEEMTALNAELLFWARWACILAGLAMVTSIWVGWSLKTLAKNQVAIARLIQSSRGG